MRPWSFLLVPALMPALVGGCDRAASPPAQGEAAASTATPDEVVADTGTDAAAPVRGIDRSHRGEAAPAHAFAGPDGRPISLAAFRGAPVLVNLWATWCAPCVKELPTLDGLAARSPVRVVALSQDSDAAKARAFMAARGFRSLDTFTDPAMRWLGGTATNLPTTILYDAKGRELWRWLGEADWTGAEAAKALAEADGAEADGAEADGAEAQGARAG